MTTNYCFVNAQRINVAKSEPFSSTEPPEHEDQVLLVLVLRSPGDSGGVACERQPFLLAHRR